MNRIISIKTNTLFLVVMLFTGTIVASSPSFMVGAAQAEPYYGMDKDRKTVAISSLKCNNINVNVNGLELDVFPPFLGSGGLAAEEQEGSTDASSVAGNGVDGSEINDFRFIFINNNNNAVIRGEEPPIPPEPTIPPEPPEPTTATLTVNKEVFGCDNSVVGNNMDCQQMINIDTAWLPCINSVISNYLACLGLPPSLFDIEVLDNQGNQLQQFEGSTQGTTIENLQPGTYTVNEIKYQVISINWERA